MEKLKTWFRRGQSTSDLAIPSVQPQDAPNTTFVDVDKRPVIKILVVGPSQSGKSAIVSRFLDNCFAPQYLPTFGPEFRIIDLTQTQFIDLPSKIRLQLFELPEPMVEGGLLTHFLVGVHAIAMVFDNSSAESFREMEHIKARLEAGMKKLIELEETHQCGSQPPIGSIIGTRSSVDQPVGQAPKTSCVPIVLVANKADISGAPFTRRKIETYALKSRYNAFFFTTATKGSSVSDMFHELLDLVLAQEQQTVKVLKNRKYQYGWSSGPRLLVRWEDSNERGKAAVRLILSSIAENNHSRDHQTFHSSLPESDFSIHIRSPPIDTQPFRSVPSSPATSPRSNSIDNSFAHPLSSSSATSSPVSPRGRRRAYEPQSDPEPTLQESWSSYVSFPVADNNSDVDRDDDEDQQHNQRSKLIRMSSSIVLDDQEDPEDESTSPSNSFGWVSISQETQVTVSRLDQQPLRVFQSQVGTFRNTVDEYYQQLESKIDWIQKSTNGTFEAVEHLSTKSKAEHKDLLRSLEKLEGASDVAEKEKHKRLDKIIAKFATRSSVWKEILEGMQTEVMAKLLRKKQSSSSSLLSSQLPSPSSQPPSPSPFPSSPFQ